MRKIKKVSMLFVLLFQLTINAQENFEGILKFKIEFQDKTGEMTDEQSKQFVGNKQTYYIKGKKYKSELNGMLKMTTYHEGKDTVFTKMEGMSSLMYSLTSIAEEEVISYEFRQTDKIILGYECKLLEVKTNKGFHQYYFNKDLKVDPETYKEHKSGLWDFFTEKTGGALSILSITDIEDVKSSIELISVNRKKLDDSIFKRPNLLIVKMPED
ncbi:hypothetical protein [Polaribacter glomeratus]|uniref:DUF4412 domain-containing protein n=1 Tax=Polaribacter glomeratus TaxID=102 RepID=A0A2S7WIX1_9FLAO|nr:hypothetical protein [Polaribacter glomeratus]PQJ77386.1 hypothetical protein BTO16_16275 [Polaribacter glomeratus]TXD65972.1 hypothetical protein ESX12_07375 [Polaribacter glomeratus]